MMPLHSHWLVEKRLHRMFTTGMSDRARRRLMNHVDQCSSCKALCRTYYQYETALFHSTGHLAPAASDRIAKGIFDQPRADAVSRWHAPYRAIGAAAALFLIALAGILFLEPGRESHRVPLPSHPSAKLAALVPRHAASTGAPDFGIRVFALAGAEPRVAEDDSLSMCDQLTFTYTRAPKTPGYLAIFGLQQGSDIIWYYPDFEEPRSIRVSGNRVDEPLGDGFVISTHHKPGLLWIVSIFSDMSITSRSIEEAVEKLRRDGDWHASLKEMSIQGMAALHAVQLEIEECDE